MPAIVTINRPTFSDVDSVTAARFNSATILTATVADATTASEGVVRLAGDLTGTGAAPQLAVSGVTAGAYAATGNKLLSATVDAKGRVTTVAERDFADSGVTAGAYGASGLNVPRVTVTAKGLVSVAADRDIATDVIAAVRAALYPVGELLVTLRSGNPFSWLGFGTWVAFGAGRTLVGHNGADADFDTAEETGGAKTHTLSAAQMPAHTHSATLSGTTGASGAHYHLMVGDEAVDEGVGAPTAASFIAREWSSGSSGQRYSLRAGTAAATLGRTSDAASHTHTFSAGPTATTSAGSGEAHNNLPPYIVAFFWKRTA